MKFHPLPQGEKHMRPINGNKSSHMKKAPKSTAKNP